jgi:hypothetical protein
MKIILFLILSSTIIFAQDDSIMEFFPGKWKMDSDNTGYHEEWKIVNETELVGTGYTVEEGKRIESEKIYLKKFGDEWAYVAIPQNQVITLFALTEYSENKFTFENGEHDFPQRIIYEFSPDGQLNAMVEGTLDGELMKREFIFTRVED